MQHGSNSDRYRRNAEIAPTSEYGIILPSMETEDIANALEKAAISRGQSRLMGANAAKRVRENYTWDKSAQLLLAACKKQGTRNADVGRSKEKSPRNPRNAHNSER